MSNRELLKQGRDMVRRSINESPTEITISVYPTKDNGFGDQVPDTSQPPDPVTHKVRIAHERGIVPKLEEYSAGLDSNRNLFLLADHNFTGGNGQLFTFTGREWRIETLNPIIKFGGVVGYTAQLVQGS